MRKVLALAGKDLRLLIRDRAGFFFVFFFPLLYAIFFGFIFSGGGSRATPSPSPLWMRTAPRARRRLSNC